MPTFTASGTLSERSTTSLPATGRVGKLQAARNESDRLFDIIKQGNIYDRPINARHRVIFYVGHLESFDVIQISRETASVVSPEPALDKLFEAGIDPDSEHLPTDQPRDWPSFEEVLAYRERCRRLVDEALERVPENVVDMVIEHRLMHIETLAYMFHNFDYAKKNIPKPLEPVVTSGRTPVNEWIEIPSGQVILGRPAGGSFGWDNEYGEWMASVPAFRIQKRSVSNGEYLEFVKDGAEPPNFWKATNGEFLYRGMFAEFPLPLDWPVYVTQDQARSYTEWSDHSLMSEQQFHRAAYGSPHGEERQYPWGAAQPARVYGNFDFHRWDPEPVWAAGSGDSAFGVSQLVGNGWQWTSTPFGPFPGFRPRATYPGYSANFFDGEHFVMKGASARTAAEFLRRSFRNWFRHDYPYTYATFRCVD